MAQSGQRGLCRGGSAVAAPTQHRFQRRGTGRFRALPSYPEERRTLVGRARLCRTEARFEKSRRPHRGQRPAAGDQGRPRYRRDLFGRRQGTYGHCPGRGGAVRRRLQHAAATNAVGHRTGRPYQGAWYRRRARQAGGRRGPAGPYRLCVELADREQGSDRRQPGGYGPHGKGHHRAPPQTHRHHDHALCRGGRVLEGHARCPGARHPVALRSRHARGSRTHEGERSRLLAACLRPAARKPGDGAAERRRRANGAPDRSQFPR